MNVAILREVEAFDNGYALLMEVLDADGYFIDAYFVVGEIER